MTRLIAFDLDGVLWDSQAKHEEAFRKTLHEFGYRFDQKLLKQTFGASTKNILKEITELPEDSKQLNSMVDRKRFLAAELLSNEVRLNEEALQLIKELKINGIKVALVSGSSEKNTQTFLNKIADIMMFDYIFHGENVDRTKPSPDIYLELLAVAKIHCTDVLAIEDSESGIRSAANAGIRVIRFSGYTEVNTDLGTLSEYVLGSEESLNFNSLQKYFKIASNKTDFDISLIIPAAGEGKRLGSSKPKALTFINNETIIDRLLSRTARKLSSQVVVVANESQIAEFREHFKNIAKFKVIAQKGGSGSYFAVKSAIEEIDSQYVIIVWADQVFIDSELIIGGLNLLNLTSADCIIPVCRVAEPYVNFDFRDFKVIRINQSRDTGLRPTLGYSDCGTFIFRTIALKKFLSSVDINALNTSVGGTEINFIDIFLYPNEFEILPMVTSTDSYTRGINTKQELDYAINYFLDEK